METKIETQCFDISGFSAAVIGCGGLGTNAAVHLVGAGIGKLYLCDFDTVSATNLNRQFLYTKNDVGKYKVEVIARRLNEYSDDTDIRAKLMRVEYPGDLDFARDCDIILSCTDNGETRKIIRSFADEHIIPVVEGGIDGFYGICCLRLPNSGSVSEELFEGENSETSVSCTAGIIGSAQAALAIRYLLTNDCQQMKKLLVYDEDSFSTLILNNSNEVTYYDEL